MITVSVLKYYNPDEDLTVQSGVLDNGLGSVLMQGGQPIAYASRAVLPPETAYSQTERNFWQLSLGWSISSLHLL